MHALLACLRHAIHCSVRLSCAQLPRHPTASNSAVAARMARILACLEAQPATTRLAPPTTDWLLALAPAVEFAPLRLLLQNANNRVGTRGLWLLCSGPACCMHRHCLSDALHHPLVSIPLLYVSTHAAAEPHSGADAGAAGAGGQPLCPHHLRCGGLGGRTVWVSRGRVWSRPPLCCCCPCQPVALILLLDPATYRLYYAGRRAGGRRGRQCAARQRHHHSQLPHAAGWGLLLARGLLHGAAAGRCIACMVPAINAACSHNALPCPLCHASRPGAQLRWGVPGGRHSKGGRPRVASPAAKGGAALICFSSMLFMINNLPCCCPRWVQDWPGRLGPSFGCLCGWCMWLCVCQECKSGGP